MSPVQIEKLRPQINALAAQFETSEVFITSLESLFESYRAELELSSNSFTAYALIPSLNIPEVVLNQLEIIINHKAPLFPEQSKDIAEQLWKKEILEFKQIALIITTRLFTADSSWFLYRINDWVNEDTPQPIIDLLLSGIRKNGQILNHSGWEKLMAGWLNFDSVRLNKIGLTAITDKAIQKEFQDLPDIFKAVENIFAQPSMALSKEMHYFVNQLIKKSEPEISAFLIHMSIMHPTPPLTKFIRKCLPAFSKEFQVEIANRLN